MKSIRHKIIFIIVASLFSTLFFWFAVHPLEHYNGVMRSIDFTLSINLTNKKQDNMKPTVPANNVTQKPTEHDFRNNKNQSITGLLTVLQTPWKRNLTNVLNLRSDLAKMIHTDMIISKNNTKPNQKIGYLLRSSTTKITKKFYDRLPKISPIQMYKRCSIVGNAGILNGSECGDDIDKADFVVRCNTPPINRFKKDAGAKSNLTTLNPSVITKRFASIRNGDAQNKFIEGMKEYNGYIYFPSFSVQWIVGLSDRVSGLLSKRSKLQLLHGNPNHVRDVSKYWKSKGITTRLSTGFYLITEAISICDEVHLYGFWPFSTDIHGHPIPYHYHDNIKLRDSIKVHNFDGEFDEIIRLHSSGVLQLHVDSCH